MLDLPSPARMRHLLRLSVLFLAVSYVVLLGGTFNGLVLYRLNVATTILIAVAAVSWIIWFWRRPFPATRLDGALLALLAAYLLATATSLDPRRSAGATLLMLLYVAAFYLVVDLRRGGWPASLFVGALLFAGAFILFFGLWELQRWYAGWIAVGGWANPIPPATLRIRAFLGHPNFVAPFFNVLIPLALTQALGARRLGRLGWGAWAAIALVLVFFTSSRSGWLGLAAGLGSWLGLLLWTQRAAWRVRWQQFRRRRAAGVLLALAAVPLLAGAGYALYRQAQHPTHAGRDYIWRVAVDMFRQSPLTGTGPWTYGTEFIAAYSVPPQVLLAHAHNYFLNTLAETGALGFLALAAVLILGGRVAWQRWQSADAGQRMVLAGYLAALAGLGVNSLFDTPQTFPAISLMAVVVGGLLVSDDVPSAPRVARYGRWGLAAGLAVVVGALLWSLRAYAPFSSGVLAAFQGDWSGGGAQIARAARLDPANAFYWLQSGFAQGRAALDDRGLARDPAAMANAIADYRRGIELEPIYAVNHANLGVLLMASGDYAAGVAELELAAARAPNAPPFRATLGLAYEATSQNDAAALEYQAALTLRPDWANAYFFRASPLRRQALADWQAQHPDHWMIGGAELTAGWRALAAGQAQEAVAAFQAAAGLNRPEVYLGLGLAYLAQSQPVEAEAAVRTSLFVPGASGQTTALTQFVLGRALAAQGRNTEAVAAYEAGLNLLNSTTAYGVGLLGQSDYGWYIYYRESLPPDLLPGVQAVHYSAEAVAAMVALGDLAEASGQAAESLEWYCRALAAAPDDAAASDRVADWGGCPA